MKPTLYIMVGYPGAGKTTTARYIAELTGAIHIWTDYERQQLFGHTTFDESESKQLYDTLNARASHLLTEGHSVVFDTNFRFKKDRDAMRLLAEEAGATLVTIWLTTDRDLAEQRATHLSANAPNRVFGNMTAQDFATKCTIEPVTAEEQAIGINGVDLTKDMVAHALDIPLSTPS